MSKPKNSSYARPLQGISQQPPEVRQEGQCEWQENMATSVTDGLVKRAGTKLLARIPFPVSDSDKVHYYNRGDSEKYWIVVTKTGSVRVIGDDGIEHTVLADTDSLKYLQCQNARKQLQAQTISDYTFLSSELAKPAWSPDREQGISNTALIPVLFADYGKTYSIVIDGVQRASVHTPDGSTASMINDVDTGVVAKKLADQLGVTATVQTLSVTGTYKHVQGQTTDRIIVPISMPSDTIISINAISDNSSGGARKEYRSWAVNGNTVVLSTDYVRGPNNQSTEFNIPCTITYNKPIDMVKLMVRLISNTIIVSKPDNSPMTIATVDGRDGGDMPAIYHAVDDLAKLSKYAPIGYPVQVGGKGKSKDDRYWLRATRAQEGSDQIIWEEAREPGTAYKFDPYSMPQGLVRESIDPVTKIATFRLGPVPWGPRRVGNDSNNPAPSFVQDGKPVRAMGVLQNRLFFLAGESFVASVSNEFFELFKSTTQVSKDDSPIDLYADTEGVNELKSYTSLDGDLVLMSEGAQFIIKGDKALTAANTKMQRVTQYKNDHDVTPVSTGETVMFTYSVGEFAQVREFFTDSVSDTKKARPVTEHVDRLIQGKVREMIGSTNVSQIAILTEGTMHRLYIYDYLWQGADKVQSAWWIISLNDGDKIIRGVYDQNQLKLLVDRKGFGCCLESLDLGDPYEPGIGQRIRLDMQRWCKAVRLGKYKWRLDLPWSDFPSDWQAVRGNKCHKDDVGSLAKFTKVGDIYVAEQLDLAPEGVDTVDLLLGIPYLATYIPNMPFVKDSRGMVLGLDRLTVNTIYVNYIDTGSFDVEVSYSFGGEPRAYTFDGRIMGAPGNIVGFAQPVSGQFPIPVRGQATKTKVKITTDDYRPFILRNLEWKGMINPRGQRV